jgi:hypothetical protein
MAPSNEDTQWREELEQQIAEFRLRLRPFPPVHNRTTGEHQATADVFCEYANKWLTMAVRFELGDDEDQHVLYTLLWCAKDIAHPYSDRAWEKLGVDPEALRVKLEWIVRFNVEHDTDKDAALAFANKCKGVGVSLADH